MKRRVFLFLIIPVVGVALFLTGAILFQDNISRYLINPRVPYQALTPPQAPDYIDQKAWALWPDLAVGDEIGPGEVGEAQFHNNKAETLSPTKSSQLFNDKAFELDADIFYIHGTTYHGRARWNAAINDPDAVSVLQDIALPNEIGPFAKIGTVFAPRYRQATLFARFTHKYAGNAARSLAYDDIRNAFRHYLNVANPERLLVLVGYDQGGLYITGLLQEFIARDQRLQDRLAAVYVLRHGVPVGFFKTDIVSIVPCEKPYQSGCMISYNPFERHLQKGIDHIKQRSLAFDADLRLRTIADDLMLCVNPLSWRIDEDYSEAKHHKGAASASGLVLNQDPPFISESIGAQCESGVLLLDRPSKRFLRRNRWFGRQWRAQPFNLFYADLREDVSRRLEYHRPVLAERFRQLDPIPIGDAVELIDSPIKKVPK